MLSNEFKFNGVDKFVNKKIIKKVVIVDIHEQYVSLRW